MIKRIFDFILSLTALLILWPLLILIAILVKLDSSGNVLYNGGRVGQYGRPFRVYKFRTMVGGADKMGGPSTSADDPRLTNLGKTLRKHKLDELPQLFNILMGKMSFVGCRPEVLPYIRMMTNDQRRVILSVKPGLSDLATLDNMSEGERLRGKQDPEAFYREVIRPHKVKLQQIYVETRTFWLDLKILVHTIIRIFK